jgi:hypothetical protein
MGKSEEVDFPRYRLVQLSARPKIWSFVFVVLICCRTSRFRSFFFNRLRRSFGFARGRREGIREEVAIVLDRGLCCDLHFSELLPFHILDIQASK